MQTNKILRWIAICGIFALPFIFFWVPGDMFFPYITGRNILFRMIVEIIGVLWMILAIRDAAYRPKRTWIFYACSLFLVVLAVADIFGVNPARSFWSNFERMEGFITQLHLFLLFIVAGAVLTTEGLWEAFWQTSIGASVIMCLTSIGAIVSSQGASRVAGQFGNAAYLAVYLMMHIFLVIYFIIKYKKSGWRLALFIPVLLLELYVLYHTATRGDILGLGAGLLIAAVAIGIWEKADVYLRRAALGMIGVLAIVFVGFLAVRNLPAVRNNAVLGRFASISTSDGTTESRFMIWKMAIKGFEAHPILGYGQENFNVVFNKYYDPGMYGQESWFDRTHDIFFDWLVAGGLLGLLSYLSIFGAAIYMLVRSKRLPVWQKAIFGGLLAAYFFQNLFVFDNLGSYFLFFMMLSFLTLGEEAQPVLAGISLGEGGQLAGTMIVGAVGIFFFWYLNIPLLQANYALIDALQSNVVPTRLADFQKAISYDTSGDEEIREQIIESATGVAQASGIPDADKKSFIGYAADQMNQQITEVPGDARTRLLFGSFLTGVGAADQGLAQLQAALALSPQKQTIMFEIASSYLGSKNYDAALAEAKQAFDEEPDYAEARAIYATVAIYAGKPDIVASVLQGHENVETTDDRILKAYFDTKQTAKVEMIWLARTEAGPSDPTLAISYAASLAESGKSSAAIAEMKKAQALEDGSSASAADKASFDKDVATYISQIQSGTFK